MKLRKYSFLLLLLMVAFAGKAQEGVRNTNESKKGSTARILLCPFEPKMYRSEIDMKINVETNWTAAQINEYFRRQLDQQLRLKLQDQVLPVLSFYSDSAKMAKDLSYIYKTTSISFDNVSKPGEPTAAASKRDPGIHNGQLEVALSTDRKFSNLRLSAAELVPYLSKKYSSDYFVFVNELDILTLPESYDLATDSYQREVTVHYTVIDKNSKLLLAGTASSRFSSKENNPKKIINTAFSPIARTIATKLAAVLNPPKDK
jgi:hypothetical protein